MLVALALALAITAVAAEPNLMALPAIRRDVLEPRQTLDIPGLSGTCQSALSGVIGSVPSPPPRLLTAILGGTQVDPCSITVPSSLSSDFSSYSSSLNSWYSASSSELQSALSQCPLLSSFETELPLCTSRDSGGAAGGGVPLTNSAGSTTGTSTASGESSGSTDTASGASGSGTSESGASSTDSSATDNTATSTDTSSDTGSGTASGGAASDTGNSDGAASHEDGRVGILAALAAIGFAAFVL